MDIHTNTLEQQHHYCYVSLHSLIKARHEPVNHHVYGGINCKSKTMHT